MLIVSHTLSMFLDIQELRSGACSLECSVNGTSDTIKNRRPHFDSQYCVPFTFCIGPEAPG